jgi:hypothetical protein
MGPINYGAAFGSQDPTQAFMQGLQGAMGMRAMLTQQQAQEQAVAAAQAKAQQQAQMQADIQSVFGGGTADAKAVLGLMGRYPQLSEQYKRVYDGLSQEQQRASVGLVARVGSALRSGQPEVALKVLDEQIEAAKNSGDTQSVSALQAIRKATEIDPSFGLTTAYSLAAASGEQGQKLAEAWIKEDETRRAQELQGPAVARAGAEAAKAGSEAQTAAVKAKYADSQAILDLQEKGWNIKALEADVDFKRQSARIAAMNAAIAREGNDLKRQELQMKLQDTRTKRDDMVREKASEAGSARGNIDNMLNTIQRVLQSPALNDVVGSWEGSVLYPNQVAAAANLLNPFTSSGDDRADAIALVESLGSQAFLSQLPNIKGMGQLSNAEGDKLQASLQNLTRKQSEKQFRASLNEAARLMTKARRNIEQRLGVPETTPDTPAAPGARPPLASFER